MDIIQVNNCDLTGRRFNGHDLQLSLNKLGHKSFQFVLEKYGNEPTTIPLCNPNELFIRSIIRNLEYQLSMANLLYPFGNNLLNHSLFKNADIIHYHLIHNYFLSIFDFLKLTSLKPSVWTVHDPWVVTGHCIYPRECMGWKNGCLKCPNVNDAVLPMQMDKASQIWKIKNQVYCQMDVDIIVASQFMEDYIKNSPLTAHFKHIHKVPFGIEVESFQNRDKNKARDRFKIAKGSFTIAFRSDSNKNKGLKYIIWMLEKLNTDIPITLITIGVEPLPSYIAEKYHIIELGWSNDLETLYDFYAAGDVFLMPSLVESFGLMAIEAMAAGCPIVVFENTVLTEITFAPECGIAVPYKNSDSLKAAVEHLTRNPDECRWRGEKGKELARKHYRYKDYVNRHLALYMEILERKGMNDRRETSYA